MIKKPIFYLSLAILLMGSLLLIKWLLPSQKTPEMKVSVPFRPKPQIDAVNLKIDGKKVIGLTPGHEKEDLKKLKVSNYVSHEWQPILEKSIRQQAGSSLKEMSIKKVDSFVWAQDGIALYVESVIVNVKSDKNLESSFRVLVDAQNGKILKNWDQPVFDPVRSNQNFRVKVDPRYHND